jgi:hypothetical protein
MRRLNIYRCPVMIFRTSFGQNRGHRSCAPRERGRAAVDGSRQRTSAFAIERNAGRGPCSRWVA